jgi:hypothetical protein
MEVEPMNVICIFNGAYGRNARFLIPTNVVLVFLTSFLFLSTGPYNLKNPQDWMTERLISIRKRHAADREAADVEGSPQATLKSKRSKNSET